MDDEGRLLYDHEFVEQTERVIKDVARAAYVRRFYRVDPADPSHYHLVVDSTVLSTDACADMVVRTAEDRASGGN